ncbi:amidohydrolase [Clostridium oceanicum]|uniref:M20 peptidase aminoacylase family protein n=1 Tax=Clostridium oceanicum TaxID=1543 RepID=A0ABP3UNC1_9CLOT
MKTTEEKSYVERAYDYLHTIPEIGFEEFKTSKYIAEQLKSFGFDVVEEVGKTGVVGKLDATEKGPVLAIRADMDALQFEKDGEKYNVHACGHDAHSAMVLATAKNIAEKKIERGNLVVIFQPAEEKLDGSRSVIKSGYIDEIEEIVGIHLRPIQEAKLGEATPSLVHGTSYQIITKIKGLNAHGARPHLGVNAVDAAALVVNSINAIRLDPRVSHSIKVTRLIAGGDTINLIPDEAELAMDLRAQTNEVMEEMILKAKEAIINSAKSIGAEAIIEFVGGVPAAQYNDEMTSVAYEAIKEELGEVLEPLYTTGGEDFHFYTREMNVKSAYIGLGADLTPGLHHADMTFDKKALSIGVNILNNVVKNRLGLKK